MNNDITSILLVLALVALVLASFVQFKRKNPAKKGKATDNTLEMKAIRLQAYERLILLMERINPTELAMRYNGQADTVSTMQKLLLEAVRAETEHNYTQQLYISNTAWTQVMAARNTVMNLINQSATSLNPSDPAISLSKKIIDNAALLEPLPTLTTIKTLKAEAKANT
jgi:hypothetical protein